MIKSSKHSTTKIKKKVRVAVDDADVEACLALAWAFDTQDLRVPWDWRAAHMEEIEERLNKNKQQQGS